MVISLTWKMVLDEMVLNEFEAVELTKGDFP